MPVLPLNLPKNKKRTPCADKNDKLGWKAGFSLTLEGVSFGVRTNEADLLPQLRSYFPGKAIESDDVEVDVLLSFLKGRKSERKGVEHYHLVYEAWTRVARTRDFDEATNLFVQALKNRLAVFSQDKLYIYASVFDWQGRGLVLLGATPEIVKDLVSAGAKQFGDELAQLNQSHQLESWENPATSLTPALVVVAQKGKVKTLQETRLTPGITAIELIARTLGTTNKPQNALNGVVALSQGAPGYRAIYARRADLVRFLSERLRSEPVTS